MRRSSSELAVANKVLVVVHNDETRLALVDALYAIGHQSSAAASASDAIQCAIHGSYTALIVDTEMPGTACSALIERLMPTQRNAGLVLLCATTDAYSFPGMGATQRLEKDRWNVEELAAAIRVVATEEDKEARVRGPILLIEDNEADRELIGHYLGAWLGQGVVLKTADRLESALNLIHQERPEAILADLSLPDAQGLEGVRRLASVAEQSAIVVLTGRDDERLGLRAIQIGAQDYLSKSEVDSSTIRKALLYAVERKRAAGRLAHLAHHDHLTGLCNRLTLKDRLQHAIEAARRDEGRFATVFVDLDEFKSINDQYGHKAGDDVLRAVASRLSRTVRASDLVARIGGDEFVVLLENLDQEERVNHFVDRVARILGEPFDVAGRPHRISASLGVAFYPDAGQTVDDIIGGADRAMYDAKRQPGHSVSMFVPKEAPDLSRAQLQNELRDALREDRFELHYQPIVDLRDQEVLGFEALLRWKTRSGQIVAPARFIPVLEETGLIIEVGRWILRAACAQAKRLENAGLPLRIAVNLSARQFDSDDLVETIARAAHAVSIPTNRLELELTETCLMRDTERTQRALVDMSALGARISIDDFGTGYSSLAYLHRFKIDTLKIDQGFIHALFEDSGSAKVVRAIIKLGHELGFEVLGEGVETPEQLQFLKDNGCDAAQGFFLGRPAAQAEPESGLGLPDATVLAKKAI